MVHTLWESLKGACEFLPFMCLTTEGRPELNTARLVEGIMIALITGSVTVWGTLQALEVKLDASNTQMTIQLENMSKDINKIDKKVNSIYRDFYKPRVSK